MATAQTKQELQDAEVDVRLREEDDAAAAENSSDPELATIADDDVDAIEAASAIAALEKEEGDTSGEDANADEGAVQEGVTTPATPKEDPPATTSAADEAPGTQPGKDDGVMIPKQRFDEAVGKARAEASEAREREEFWKGVAAGRAQGAPVGSDPQAVPQAPLTPEDQIAAVRTEQTTLAKAYDDGDMSMAEYKAADVALDDQVHGIRAAAAQPVPQGEPAAPPEDLRLQELTASLNDAHPYIQEGVLDEASWRFLSTKALDSLAEQGVDLPRGVELSPSQQYLFRKEVATQSDVYGPGLAPGFKVPPAGAAATTKSSKDPSAVAAARAEQLASAQQQPANTNGLGAGGGTVDISEEELVDLSDEEIENLPASVRGSF